MLSYVDPARYVSVSYSHSSDTGIRYVAGEFCWINGHKFDVCECRSCAMFNPIRRTYSCNFPILVLVDRLSFDIRPYSSWRKARDTYNSIFDWRGEPNVSDFIAYDWYYCNGGPPYRSQLVMALNAKAVLPRSQGAYVN